MTTLKHCRRIKSLDAKAERLHDQVATVAKQLSETAATGIEVVDSARALTTIGELLLEAVRRERAEVVQTLRAALASDSSVMAIKVALLVQKLEGKA